MVNSESGCEYCRGGISLNGCSFDVCTIKIRKNRMCTDYSDEFYNTDVKINYCPMCGRKLEESN